MIVKVEWVAFLAFGVAAGAVIGFVLVQLMEK